MSKTRTTDEGAMKRQSEGCCCGDHRPGATEVKKTVADTGSVVKHDVHDNTHEPQGRSGCCGGHKAHK